MGRHAHLHVNVGRECHMVESRSERADLFRQSMQLRRSKAFLTWFVSPCPDDMMPGCIDWPQWPPHGIYFGPV